MQKMMETTFCCPLLGISVFLIKKSSHAPSNVLHNWEGIMILLMQLNNTFYVVSKMFRLINLSADYNTPQYYYNQDWLYAWIIAIASISFGCGCTFQVIYSYRLLNVPKVNSAISCHDMRLKYCFMKIND